MNKVNEAIEKMMEVIEDGNTKKDASMMDEYKNDIQLAIGERVRSARESLGYSQRKVARMLDMNAPSYTNRENGNARFHAEEIVILAEVLKVQVGWLLGNDPIVDSRISYINREIRKFSDRDIDTIVAVVSSIRSKNSGG